MKVSQADTINQLYKNFNDTIASLKDTITIKNKNHVQLNKEIYLKQDTINRWKTKYETSAELFSRIRTSSTDSKVSEEEEKFTAKAVLVFYLLIIYIINHK
jgi:hypothetical protein